MPRQSPTNLQLFLHFIDHHGSINISSSPWFLSRGSCFFAPLLGFSNEVKSVNDKRSSFLNWWMTKSMSVHGSSIPLPSSPVHYSRVCFEKKIWLSVFFCEDKGNNGKIQYYNSEFLVEVVKLKCDFLVRLLNSTSEQSFCTLYCDEKQTTKNPL